MTLPLRPPVRPMLARLARELPSGDYVYEPKWDGFRCTVFRDGDDVDLRSRHDRPLARYFPEVTEALRRVRQTQFVLDGEIVVTRGGALDFPALMARLHPARSRVQRLREETPATLIAFDLLATGEDVLCSLPFAERRALLEALLRHSGAPLAVTPATDDPELAARWLESFAGGGIDGVVAKAKDLTYQPGVRAMTKVKRERTADCVVAGFRWLAERPALGSLLLGLYDEGGRLIHIGVATSFAERQRGLLLQTLWPLVTPLERHPWRDGFGLERSPLGRLAGAAGRWSPGMEPDWIPVEPVLVCEAAYEQLDGHRLRHPARFRRWRPDREPRSCTLEQLEEAAPAVPAGLLRRPAA